MFITLGVDAIALPNSRNRWEREERYIRRKRKIDEKENGQNDKGKDS